MTDQHVAPPFSNVEYLAAAPIQAALEKCEAGALHPDGQISFRNEDYAALVKAVKNNVTNHLLICLD